MSSYTELIERKILVGMYAGEQLMSEYCSDGCKELWSV